MVVKSQSCGNGAQPILPPTSEPSAAFTPGPWRIRVNPKHAPLDGEIDLSICGDIFVLADINGPAYDHQEANARLIAAAPDLLKALQSAAKTFRRYEAMHAAKGTVEGAQKAAGNAWCAKDCEAAIAKALGPSAHDTSSATVPLRDANT